MSTTICSSIPSISIDQVSDRFETVRLEVTVGGRKKSLDLVGELHVYSKNESERAYRALLGYDTIGAEGVRFQGFWGWAVSIPISSYLNPRLFRTSKGQPPSYPGLRETGNMLVAQKQRGAPYFDACQVEQSSLRNFYNLETAREPTGREKVGLLLAAGSFFGFKGVIYGCTGLIAGLTSYFIFHRFRPQQAARFVRWTHTSLGPVGRFLKFVSAPTWQSRLALYGGTLGGAAMTLGLLSVMADAAMERLVPDRNVEMAQRIRLMAFDPQSDRMVAVMGKEHLPGLLKLLEESESDPNTTFRRIR